MKSWEPPNVPLQSPLLCRPYSRCAGVTPWGAFLPMFLPKNRAELVEIWTIAIYSTPTNPKIQGQKTISPALICHWKAAENVPAHAFSLNMYQECCTTRRFSMEVRRLHQRSKVIIVAGSKFKCRWRIDLSKNDKKWQRESPRRLYTEIVALRPTYDICLSAVKTWLIHLFQIT